MRFKRPPPGLPHCQTYLLGLEVVDANARHLGVSVHLQLNASVKCCRPVCISSISISISGGGFLYAALVDHAGSHEIRKFEEDVILFRVVGRVSNEFVRTVEQIENFSKRFRNFAIKDDLVPYYLIRKNENIFKETK